MYYNKQLYIEIKIVTCFSKTFKIGTKNQNRKSEV